MELDAVSLAIVEQIYAAATEPAIWTTALKGLADMVCGRHAILFINRVSEQSAPYVAVHGVSLEDAGRIMSPEASKLLTGPWQEILSANTFVSTSQYFSDEEQEKNEFYLQYIQPIGGFYAAAVQRSSSTHSYNVTICRSRSDGPFDKADMDRLQPMLPFLSAAVSIHHRLQASEERSAGFARSLWRLEHAVIVVDRLGKPLVVNDQARNILAQNDGLSLSPLDELTAKTAQITDQLKKAISDVASSQHETERTLALPRNNARLPLAITIASVARDRKQEAGWLTAHAVIFIKELDGTFSTDQDGLIGVFKLTPREAEIAGLLANGLSAGMIAAKLGLTAGTVRFNLKRIFDKTGAHHQGALIALVRNFGGH